MLTLLKPFITFVFAAGSVVLGAAAIKSPSPADLAVLESSSSIEEQLQAEDLVKNLDISAQSAAESSSSTSSSTSTTSTSTSTTTTVPTREQLLQAYSMRQEILEPHELRELLELTGFEGDGLRSAWAIVMRESRGKPLAFNGNEATKDSSYGLFQINMRGYLGRHRAELYGLEQYEELFDPVTNAAVAFEMSQGGTQFGPWCVGPNGYNGCRVGDYPYWLTQFPEEVSIKWPTDTSVMPSSRQTR